MDDPSWASYSLPLIETQCEAAIWRQSKKWRKKSSTEKSSIEKSSLEKSSIEKPPQEIIDVLNCPNLCSDRGTCNGKKCVCNQGFSGPSCNGQKDL